MASLTANHRTVFVAAYTFPMRLTPAEHTTIRETVQAIAGTGSRVRLFGSRLDDRARGGDIDLLVELDHAAHACSRRSVTGGSTSCSLRPTCAKSPFTASPAKRGSSCE